jgi:hypothetical protein
MIRISIKDLTGRQVLAGTLNGRKVFAKLLDQIGGDTTEPELVFLDFDGVQVATASFLRETVFSFRDNVRRSRSNFYPVVANANEAVKEELNILAKSDSDVLMLCSLDNSNRPRNPHLAGELDPKQRLTFNLVCSCRETDAAQLMREHGKEEKVKQTAWNNRLAALANLGLICELNQGRTKRYRTLFAES